MPACPCSSIRRLLFRAATLLFVAFGLFLTTTTVADEKAVPGEKMLTFEADILPIFRAKCAVCHNPKSKKAELDLTTFTAVQRGSESGKVFDRKKPADGVLYEMVHEGYMPPEDKPQLSKVEKETILDWIKLGTPSNGTAEQMVEISQHDIVPIMNLRCTVCHGLRLQEGGLDLRTKAAMLRGGKSGPAIVLGKPEESLALKRIHAREMPPRKKLVDFGVRPIESPEIETLTKWIQAGAPEIELKPDVDTTDGDPLVSDEDRQFWSFQPPQRPAVPSVKHQALVRNEIDAFLLRKLEENGLSYSAVANRQTLIRRVAFDLTGLPPAWREVEEFLADKSETAYEKMVDHYLDSPRYGERWGNYWLDIAGYADSEGKRSADVVRNYAWKYRDYVIRAFNSDKPYDRFLLEQLAGDELADYEKTAPIVSPEIYDNLVATGFLRMAPDGTGSDIVNTVAERMEVVRDELDTFGSAILGLTLKCAQCHSHKYDPIPQRDYYRMVDTFKGAYDVHDWLKSSSVPGQTKGQPRGRLLRFYTQQQKQDWLAKKKPLQAQIAAAKTELSTSQKTFVQKQTDARLAKLPPQLRDDLRTMLATPAKKRNGVQKYLAAKFEKGLRINDKQLKKLEPKYAKLVAKTDKKVKELTAKIPPEPGIRALWDRGVPSPTYVYRRGEITNSGRLVGPGVIAALSDGKSVYEVKRPWKNAKQTGRRLAMAKWLVNPNHPLTARVMINRVWRFHFGRGIVESLGNFGKTGVAPTHPELLDWLATEFIASKWSIKTMHRLMMNSSAYRQSSALTAQLAVSDTDNKLLARMPMRRMEAEVVRDSILSVAGQLDATSFGQPDAVTVRPDGLVTSNRTNKGWRRSIYVLHRRKEMPTILENFDLPQMSPNCVQRPDSTVSSQALHLLNNKMIRDLADDFASRVREEVGDQPYRQVERIYQVALGRLPSEVERQASLEALRQLTEQWKNQLQSKPNAGKKTNAKKKPNSEKQKDPANLALGNFCHTVINSAAFVYID